MSAYAYFNIVYAPNFKLILEINAKDVALQCERTSYSECTTYFIPEYNINIYEELKIQKTNFDSI